MIGLIPILNSELINGVSNGAQLIDVALNLAQSNDEQVIRELIKSEKDMLVQIIELEESQSEKLDIIQKQNEEILNLLNK